MPGPYLAEFRARAVALVRAGDNENAGLSDIPTGVAAEGEAHRRPGADAVFESACDFVDWPVVPIRVLSGGGDRFFPLDFRRGVARDRLNLEPEVVPGGHLIALSNPDSVAYYLPHR